MWTCCSLLGWKIIKVMFWNENIFLVKSLTTIDGFVVGICGTLRSPRKRWWRWRCNVYVCFWTIRSRGCVLTFTIWRRGWMIFSSHLISFFPLSNFFVRLLIYLRNYVAGLSFLCFEFWQQKFSKQRAHEVESLKYFNNCMLLLQIQRWTKW